MLIYRNYKLLKDMNIMFFLLFIAFISALLLRENDRRSDEPYVDNQQPNSDPTPQQTQTIDEWFLVLVIKADGSEDLIQTLNTKKKVTSERWESLYRATKGLWMGTERDFNDSDELERYFTTMPEVPENERSPYDVNFVQIQLNESEPKFERGVNSMERADAFQELPNKTHRVIRVSPRLSCKAYDNPIFYR